MTTSEIIEAMFEKAPKRVKLTRHVAIKFRNPYLDKHPEAILGFKPIPALKGFVFRNDGLPYSVEMSRDRADAVLHIHLEKEMIVLKTSLQEAAIFMQRATEHPDGFHLAVSLEGHNSINTLPVKAITRTPASPATSVRE